MRRCSSTRARSPTSRRRRSTGRPATAATDGRRRRSPVRRLGRRGPASCWRARPSEGRPPTPASSPPLAAADLPDPIAWDAPDARRRSCASCAAGDAGVTALEALDRLGPARPPPPRVGGRPVPSAARSVPPVHRRRAPARRAGTDRPDAGRRRARRTTRSPPRPLQQIGDPRRGAAGGAAARHRQERRGRSRARSGSGSPGSALDRMGVRGSHARPGAVHGRAAPAPAGHGHAARPHRRRADHGRRRHDRHARAAGGAVPARRRRRRRHRSRRVDAVAAEPRARARREGAARVRAWRHGARRWPSGSPTGSTACATC